MSTNSYVYIQSERAGSDGPGETWGDLWTVGFYDPDGKWQPDEDFSSKDGARRRVHYLNGGETLERLNTD